MGDFLRVQTEGTLTRVTLCRPETGNCLSAGMVNALSEVLARCAEGDTTMFVLSGEGTHFCTGFDLSGLEEETDDSLLARFTRIELLLQQLHAAPFMTVVLGQGRIVGAGADLFAACQRRVILGEAVLRFPGAAFGLVLGTGRLAHLVGPARARDWAGSGCWITKADALSSGLASCCLAPGEVTDYLRVLAQDCSRLDSATRHSLYQVTGYDSSRRARELAALVVSAARPGIKQRIQAFRAAARRR